MKNCIRIFILINILFACSAPHQSVTSTTENENDTTFAASFEKEQEPYPFCEVKQAMQNALKQEPFLKLNGVYKYNNYEPYFTCKRRVVQGLTVLRNSYNHGLNPKEYNYKTIDSLYGIWDNNIANDTLACEIELLLCKGIYKFCRHLSSGKLKAANYHFSWNISKNKQHFDSLFSDYLRNNISEIESYFEPKSKTYKELKNALKKYSNLERTNDYSITYPGILLHAGDSNEHVVKLKKQLRSKGYYTGSLSYTFNDSLLNAIKSFQSIHSLNPDGAPGKRTYACLNWTVERYVNTIKVNLERVRWLPDSIDYSGILVNIPAALMQVNSDSGCVFESKLVIGKYKNQTPVYYSELDYLVFNPCWTVPHSIATEKMLPKLKKDSNYLKNRNMFVGLNGVEQETDNVDFSKYNSSNFPYKIYQRNGSGNALGKVKFIFHNPYSVYLHDTPSKSLFNKDIRTFSHGCLRVQKSMEFADLLLYKLNNNPKPKKYYLKKGYPEIVNLKNRIPISLVYLTCFLNSKTGKINYCSDVYSKDLKVLFDLEKINN